MTTPSKTPPGDDPKQLERTGTVREIGSQAVWSLSSCKPGFGVDQLRDDNLETYWQSDGSQPHLVNIQFRRKTTVKTLCVYADYKSDESYTPSKVSVRVGNNFHDLKEMRQLELVEPSGWIHVPLTDINKKPIRTFMIQIAVLANHQNGRDTHMRQIKVYTPVEESSIDILKNRRESQRANNKKHSSPLSPATHKQQQSINVTPISAETIGTHHTPSNNKGDLQSTKTLQFDVPH